MKLIWIHLAAIAILVGFAFGQADSLNMTLVDRWLYYTAENEYGAILDLIDDCAIVATREHVFFFELSSSGELTLLDSLILPDPGWPITMPNLGDITHSDSIIYFHKANPATDETVITIYVMINPGVLDSITSFTLDHSTGTNQISDTLLYLYSASVCDCFVLNISNPISPSIIVQGDFGHFITYGAFWGDYPYLYNGGSTYIESSEWPYEEYYMGLMNIMDVSDPDSQFISYSALSEYGSFYHSSHFNSMSKKDSLLYIGGRNRYIEVYDVAADGSDAPFVSSWGDSTAYSYPLEMLIDGNLLYTCGSEHVRIFDISDPLDIENVAYYINYDYISGYPAPLYAELCVVDSFVLVVGRLSLDGIISVEVFKSPFVSMSNYEEVSLPIYQELTAYPNPFNAACKITIPTGFTADIYDIHGRQVHALPSGSSIWNVEGQPSGVYLVRAQKGDVVVEKRVVLVK